MSIMLKEFLDSSDSLRQVINNNKVIIAEIAEEFKKRGIRNVTTVARGSSDNAATYFKYLAEVVGGIMVSKFSPSITTIYGSRVDLSENMVVVISQSGQSTDSVMVAKKAVESGGLVVAITNDAKSPLAKACDYHIDLMAGEEYSVAASKTFICQLGVLYMLANKLSKKSAKMNIAKIPPMMDEFKGEYNGIIEEFSKKVKGMNNFIILSRGLLQSVTAELSLKMMENCYRFSRPFSTSEFMHGPISLVEEGTVVYMLAADSEFREEFISMATRLSILGATIVAITDIKEVAEIAHYSLRMPTLRGMEAPFLYTLAIELLTVHTAKALNINPDTPRNMKKITVTV